MENIKASQCIGLYEAFNYSNQLGDKTLGNCCTTPSSIVFIDSAVDGYESLVDGAIPEAEVIVLNSTQDGVVQITEALQKRSEISAIHIVSHGSPGCLYLGNTQLSLDTLECYASQLQTWATHLTLSSLLLYGCNVAAGDAGEEFVEELHQLTGANIAASAERIGHATKGGSWNLERRLGQITTSSAFLPELLQAYSGVFAVSFSDASNFPVGIRPSAIATGDLDSDGDLDLVTANSDSNSVSVLLNNGQGSFSAATSSPFGVGLDPTSVALGDFNGDGNLDLVTANSTDQGNPVSVLLGNGNGSFGAATNFTVGQGAFSVTVADFNGDGNQDLAVMNSDHTLLVLFGNGAGSFALASQLTVPARDSSISVGDFNNDNNPDIVIGGNQLNEVSLLLGTGTGDFQPAQQIPTGVFLARAGAVGDFNGDGNQDLVVRSDFSSEYFSAVLLGNGDGSFGSPSLLNTGGSSTVSVGDFNLDGKLDIIAAHMAINNLTEFTSATVFSGDGNGGFAEDGGFSTEGIPQSKSITVGDFNRDGKLDIAIANSDYNNVSVLLNTITFDHLTVDTLVDENDGNLSPGDVSLREAIAFTQAGGTITFDPTLAGGTITLTQGELLIDKDLTINGLGANQLTISGNNASRVFEINDGNNSNFIDVEIEGLTIANGKTHTEGGGIYNQENLNINNSIISNNFVEDTGGGIDNYGVLNITYSTISGNTGYTDVGGIENETNATLRIAYSTISNNFTQGSGGFAGGIRNAGVLELTNSTVSDNKATAGGGISNGGTLTVTNSTISGNEATRSGGGIYNSSGTLIVRSSTITQNTTSRDGGGIFIYPGSNAWVAINNTIIAKNFDIDSSNGFSPDIAGDFDTSNSSYNLIGDGTGSNFTNGVNGNIVGTSSHPIDPLLGPLQDNGGSTFTHALLPGSPAIDAANPLNNEFIDQRGVTRPQGSGFDMGAFELLVSCPGLPCSCEQNSDPWNITNTNHPSACLTSVDTNLITPVDCFV